MLFLQPFPYLTNLSYSWAQGGIFTGNLGSWFPRNLGASHEIFTKITAFCHTNLAVFRRNENKKKKDNHVTVKNFVSEDRIMYCRKKFSVTGRYFWSHMNIKQIYYIYVQWSQTVLICIISEFDGDQSHTDWINLYLWRNSKARSQKKQKKMIKNTWNSPKKIL